MPKGFLPNADHALIGWASNFSTRINVDPPSLNIAPERAAEFAALTEAFRAAYTAVNVPGFWSAADVISKNEARSAVRAAAKMLALTVHGCPTASDEQKVLLGLTIAKERPTPAARPAEAPMVAAASVPGRRVEVRLYDRSNTSSGRRPPGTAGALVFSWSGEGEPPANPLDWKFELNTGRRQFTIQFPLDIPPGRRVYVTACWYNGRKQNGPCAVATSAELLGGGVTAMRSLVAA